MRAGGVLSSSFIHEQQIGCGVSNRMANHSRVRDISMVGAKEEYVPREIFCVLTLPLNIRAKMYVDPFFFLTASFAPPKQLYRPGSRLLQCSS
jgi:hypothetical protein